MSLYGVIALVGSIAAFWPSACWLCDLLSHFRFSFLVFAVIWLFIQLFRKRWAWILPCLVIIGLNLWSVLPFYTTTPAKIKGDKLAQFSVLQFNLFVHNKVATNVLSLIKAKNADLVALEEVESHWPKALASAGIDKLYPYKTVTRGAHNLLSGNVLYSKYPIVQVKETNDNFLDTTVNIENTLVHIFVVHTMTPTLPGHLAMQQATLKHLTKSIRSYAADSPVIVMGDFNTSPFSAEYKQLLLSTGLKDSQMGLGLQPSWPSVLPSIPIDHIFVSQNIAVNSRSVGPFVAYSDHLPVTANLTLYGKKADTNALLKALGANTILPDSSGHCPGLPATKTVKPAMPKSLPDAMGHCPNTASAMPAKPIKVCTTCPKPCNTCDPNKKH